MIDIGGGDSKLVDFLLAEGFENALEKAKQRLGDKADKVHWVVSDVTEFQQNTTYDVWHDRATFYFLTIKDQVAQYMDTARKAVTGFLTIGTFSDNGPKKCSGLDITQYTEAT